MLLKAALDGAGYENSTRDPGVFYQLLPILLQPHAAENERLSEEHREGSKKKLDAGTDPELNLLFHLWHRHNMAPGQFYRMPPGERAVVTALCEKELEVMAG